MKSLPTLGLLAALALPSAAAAQVNPDYNWTGLFTGLSLSSADYDGDMTQGDPEGDGDSNYGSAGAPYEQGGREGDFGLSFGYLYQTPGRVVIGADLSYMGGTEFDDGGEYSIFSDNRTGSEVEGVVSVNARVGYAFGNILPYIRAGIVSADITTRNGFDQGMGTRREFSSTEQADGTQIGIGVLYGISERAFVGLEYSRVEFDTVSFSGNDSLGGRAAFKGDYSADVVSLNVGIRF